MKTFCLAFALTVIVAALLADVNADFAGQVPVLPPGFVVPPPGGLGHSCSAYAKCGKGMCCLRSSSGVSSKCKRLGQHGEVCSVAPTKGDIYVGGCPCEPGLRCRNFGRNRHICVQEK
uniref:Putative ixodegrin protein n=1 Tax=Ixodes ricinus TaxID=34613 RepID=A0A0K8RJ77_IXORI